MLCSNFIFHAYSFKITPTCNLGTIDTTSDKYAWEIKFRHSPSSGVNKNIHLHKTPLFTWKIMQNYFSYDKVLLLCKLFKTYIFYMQNKLFKTSCKLILEIYVPAHVCLIIKLFIIY